MASIVCVLSAASLCGAAVTPGEAAAGQGEEKASPAAGAGFGLRLPRVPAGQPQRSRRQCHTHSHRLQQLREPDSQ